MSWVKIRVTLTVDMTVKVTRTSEGRRFRPEQPPDARGGHEAPKATQTSLSLPQTAPRGTTNAAAGHQRSWPGANGARARRSGCRARPAIFGRDRRRCLGADGRSEVGARADRPVEV